MSSTTAEVHSLESAAKVSSFGLCSVASVELTCQTRITCGHFVGKSVLTNQLLEGEKSVVQMFDTRSNMI